MTNDEFETWFRRLTVAFPDVAMWLEKHSPDPAETKRTWRHTLAKCELHECLHVLTAWIEGIRERFTYFEIASIALIVRASVFHDRDQNRKREAREAEAEEFTRAKRRSDYVPLERQLPELGQIFRQSLGLNRQFKAGAMTEAELNAARAKLLQQLDGV